VRTEGEGKEVSPGTSSTPLARETVDGVPRLLVLGKLKKVLDAFGPDRVTLTSREVSEITGIPHSTCIRLLRNLACEGILERAGDQFRLGIAIIRWGSIAMSGRSVVGLATTELDELKDKTGETAHLVVRDGFYRICVGLSLSSKSVVRFLRIGEVVPINIGSMGKIFLAFDSDAIKDLMKRDKLEGFTSKTITDMPRLLKDVATIRSLGFAISQEERDYGAIGVTLPIFDGTHQMVAGIGLSGPTQRVDSSKALSFVGAIRESASKVSSMLGCVDYDAAIAEAGRSVAFAIREYVD